MIDRRQCLGVALGAGAALGLRAVLDAMVNHGATVFDTAPGYGASEEVSGRLAREFGITNDVFWATKINVAPRGGACRFRRGDGAGRRVVPPPRELGAVLHQVRAGPPGRRLRHAGGSEAAHMIDNFGGGIGRLPDEATRRCMAELVDALPDAGD